MGRACTEKDLRAMWVFNLRYFCDNALIYADSPDCNAWILWIEPGCKGVSVPQFLLHGGLRMTAALGLGSLRRIMAYEDYSSAQRRPVYLETHLEKNTSIYKHFGFSIASDDLMPGTDLRHYGMVLE